MAYAEASDVTARWGKDLADLDDALVALIEVRLGDVERKIKRRIPDLDAQVTANTIDPDDVIQVEADAVLRLARNPEGYLSETDGNYTYMLQSELSTGRLEILPEDWDTLGLPQSRVFVISPTVEMPT